MKHRPFSAIAFSVGVALFTSWAQHPAVADTTNDCGRFYLKLNPKTGERKCIKVPGASANQVPGQSRTENPSKGRSIELRTEQTQRVTEQQQQSRELSTKQLEITRDQLDRQRTYMRLLESKQRGAL
jgi:hypothetical protein